MPLEGAGLGVEHDDAVVAVAVGDIDLVRRVVGHHVRRPAEPGLRRRALGAVVLADLLEEFSVRREFQDLVAVVVAAEPDIAVAVDVDAVLVLTHGWPALGAAPGGEQIAVGIELQHRRRGLAALGLGRVLSARPSRRRAAWPAGG